MSNNEINIIYKIEDDKRVKIFGAEFVKNNKNICKIIYDDKEYELDEYFNIPNNIKDELKIKLRGINDIINMSCIFYECSLLSIPDISKWNTNNVINMSYLFGKCENIENIPDISNWNTSNVKYMQGIFMGCKSLKSLPDISKWDTSNVILMGGIFTNLSSLSSLSIEEAMKYNNEGKELIFGGMFSECYSLKSLPDISK